MRRIGSLSALVGEKKSNIVKFSPKRLPLATDLARSGQQQEFPDNAPSSAPLPGKESLQESNTEYFETPDIRIPQSSINLESEPSIEYRKRNRESTDVRVEDFKTLKANRNPSGQNYGIAGGAVKKRKGLLLPKSTQLSLQQDNEDVLPNSFGEVATYSTHTVYLKKKESGVGLRIKNIDGKAVIKGFNLNFDGFYGSETDSIQINDVIVAVNNIDAKTASFNTIIEAFRWVPPVGDWCGLKATASASFKRNSHKQDGDNQEDSGIVAYSQITTPEQDLVASYPVKLSRVEDVLCIRIARPLLSSSSPLS